MCDIQAQVVFNFGVDQGFLPSASSCYLSHVRWFVVLCVSLKYGSFDLLGQTKGSAAHNCGIDDDSDGIVDCPLLLNDHNAAVLANGLCLDCLQ